MTESAPASVGTAEEKYNHEVDFIGAKLEVLPLFDHVVPGFSNKMPILFQFVTGRDPAPNREPFSLAVVLDISGSMQGGRLGSCKSAIVQLIDATNDEDRVSLVTYHSVVDTVFENVRCGDDGARKAMKEQVTALCAKDATNLYEGLRAGYELLRGQEAASNKHLFLLSDGLVNAGPLQRTNDILKAVENWEDKIPILSYGIGDGFNEQLMSPLGQVHKGSHYFYITDAASIESLIAKGVRALTSAVARQVCLHVTPLTRGIFFPDHLIDGVLFPLVREKSVIQYLVELDIRPELPTALEQPVDGDFEVVPKSEASVADRAAQLTFEWTVEGFHLLQECQGQVSFRATTDRSFRKHESPEVRTYMDVKRACELRRNASGSAEARQMCEQALRLFQSRIQHDRFGFAQEWANKTQKLLDDSSLWVGEQASTGAAKHLGVAYQSKSAVEEEDEEEEMDFDLFG